MCEFVYSGYSFVLFILSDRSMYPPDTKFTADKGFKFENKIRGPNKSNIIAKSRGNPIDSFFHHSILLPKIFPCRNRELHFAT